MMMATQTDCMKIQYLENEFPYIIIDNTYDEFELNLIWEELNFLCHPHKLKGDPRTTSSALRSDGTPKKNNMCLFLDNVYTNRNTSNILGINRKLLSNEMFFLKQHPNWFFKEFMCNYDTTLISYYEDSNYYERHYDHCIVTMLTWLFNEPKKFNGGNVNLHYEDNVTKIECLNNRTLIIPSMINHSVDKVEMSESAMFKKQGRICISQFLSFRDG